MPDEKICPVVASYVRCSKEYLRESFPKDLGPLFGPALDAFDELEESPLALVKDYTTQKLRAFCCLHGLFVVLRTRLGGPVHKLPLTREGIQFLIKFCSETRDRVEVKLYVDQLSGGSPTTPLVQLETERLIALTDTIVEAGEYLRPRLATEGPLSGMGRLYAQGLANVLAPSDSFIRHGRDLLNVVYNRGDLG